VPEEKLGVAVDVGSQGLVKSDEILVSALRLAELARCREALQALDGIDIGLTVGVGVRVPLAADAGVGAGALPLLEFLELLVQLSGVPGEDRRHNIGKEVGDDLRRRGVREEELRKLVLRILEVLLDSGDSRVDTLQGLFEGERASELWRLEVVEWESWREIDVRGKRSALRRSGVLGERKGGSGNSQNGCGE
jgi:hypothetical protein